VAWDRADGRFRLRVQVPVGATATVHVPGETEPVVVAHGEHTWDVPDPCPTAPSSLPEGATVRDLLDHAEAWQAVVDVAVRHTEVADDAEAARRLAAHLDGPLSRLSIALDPHGFATGGLALAERLEEALTPYR
jgi:alpha-L-rhamnosidase